MMSGQGQPGETAPAGHPSVQQAEAGEFLLSWRSTCLHSSRLSCSVISQKKAVGVTRDQRPYPVMRTSNSRDGGI